MALGINSGLSMLNASRQVSDSQRLLADAMKKLVTGKRINTAAVDPAGLVITEKMNAGIVGLGVAVSNNEKTANLVRTAEAGAGQVAGLLEKARGLIVEAANTGANDADMLKANQARLNEIVKSIGDITGQAQFGSKKLFDGNLTLTPATDGDGGTAAIPVEKMDETTLGTSAMYTSGDGTVKAVDRFANLGQLTGALEGGDSAAISQALGVVDKAISQVNEMRGKFGAIEADFINPMNESLQASYQNLQEGASQISDADAAREIGKVTQQNIMSQVKIALMAQGKENSQTLLQLLM